MIRNMRQHNITTIARDGKKPLYRVYLGSVDGKDKYKSSTNLQFMFKLVEKLNKDQELHGKAVTKEQVELLRNEHELTYAMTLCKDMDVSVIDCVKYYKDHASSITNVKIQLSEAGDLYLKSMIQKRVSDATLASTKTKVNQLIKIHGEKLVSEVTQRHIEDFIFKRKTVLAPKSVNNLLGAYSTFFTWSIKQGYTAVNPCDKIDKIKTHEAKREVLSLDEMETYLNYCKDNGYYRELVSLVLQSFCGYRVTEAASLTWGNIEIYGTLDRVVLPAAGAKLKQQRINDVPPNAKEWLKLAFEGLKIDRRRDKDKLVITYANKKFTKLRAALFEDKEIRIPTNSPRHSFASYHYAAYEDLPKVKVIMGHTDSDSMFFRHYRRMVSKRRGLLYFDIYPAERPKLPSIGGRGKAATK